MKYLWDFIFGVLLIGGAPWSVIAVVVVVSDLLEKHAHIVASDTVALVISGIMFITALFVFGAAIAYRLRKRLLPRGFIVAEIFLGVVGAFVLFMFYGVIMYSIIG